MKFNYKNHAYTIPDDYVDNAVEKYEISINEACEMWLTDNNMIINEEVEKLEEKGKKNRITQTIHGAKGEKKPRKPKEKKENPLKKDIIQAIVKGLTENFDENMQIEVTNDEKYIDLYYNSHSFTINLVLHRTKK